MIMTDLKLNKQVRKSLKNFMEEIDQSFENDYMMSFYERKKDYTNFVAFSVVDKNKFNNYFMVEMNFCRRIDLIEDLWLDYYPEYSGSSRERSFTISFNASEIEYEDTPRKFFIDKKDSHLVKRCTEYIIDSYFKLKDKFDLDSNFKKLNQIYNGSGKGPYSENDAMVNTNPVFWYRLKKLMISYCADSPDFELVYKKNKEELLALKNHANRKEMNYEKALFVFEDIYKRIKNGEIERPKSLIDIPS